MQLAAVVMAEQTVVAPGGVACCGAGELLLQLKRATLATRLIHTRDEKENLKFFIVFLPFHAPAMA